MKTDISRRCHGKLQKVSLPRNAYRFCDFDSNTIKNYRFLYFGETEDEQADTIDELMDVLDYHGVDNSTIAYISNELNGKCS